MSKRVALPFVVFIAVVAACGGDLSAPKAGPAAAITIVNGAAALGSSAGGFETADSIAVRVTDNSNHPVAGQSVKFSVVTGNGTVSAATRATGTDGIARTSWTVGSTGAQLLRASAGALTVDISATAVTCPDIAVAIGEVRSLDPADAACAILTGTSQRYLITIVNPTNSPQSSLGFTVRGTGGPKSSTTSMVTPIGMPESASAAEAQHALMLERNMELLRRSHTQGGAGTLRANRVAAEPAVRPAVGDLIPMKLPDITVNGCTVFTPIVTRVVYVGSKGIMLEDVANPLKGQVDTLYTRLGREFDEVMFPILSTNFGNPLVMDAQLNNDGAMYMVFSAKVNTMGNGLIAGYVSNADFFPVTQCPASNVAEVFYARSPTSLGAGTSEPVANWEFTRSIASTIVHEAKHLTSFAAKLSQPAFSGIKPQDGWLEESSAELAQELLSRVDFTYAAKSNNGYAATLGREVRPSSGRPMNMLNAFSWLYQYVADPESFSVVGSTAPGDVVFYGAGWGFLRWVIDTYATSEPAFLTAMTRDVSHVGVENIENLTGRPFSQLLSEYSLALALDDYPGFIPADTKYSFPSWNLRNVFAGMSTDFQKTFASPAPMKVRSSGFGKFSADVSGVRGGGFSVLELSGAQSARQLLEFKGVNGTAFPAPLRVNIVRLQ